MGVLTGVKDIHDKLICFLQVFFSTGLNFSVELKNVTLIGPLLSSPPRIQMESNLAVVSVPEVAANAEVKCCIKHITNISTRWCTINTLIYYCQF